MNVRRVVPEAHLIDFLLIERTARFGELGFLKRDHKWHVSTEFVFAMDTVCLLD